MSDLFVSYAREDLAFVRRLGGALEERELEVWLDLKGLYAGEEFQPRILAAIEAADAFAFVISPASVASAFCREEVAYAAAQNKRIIPVVVEEPTAPAPSAAAARQWIFARSEDDFDAAVESIAATLATDPRLVRAHTRLLIRSREWERAKGDPSLTLRGSDLAQAEAWLAEASRHEEVKPVPVQVEFIAASRMRERKRQRRLLTGVSLGLAVALVLAAVALFQRQEKEKQRVQAVSRELAANSAAQLEGDPQLSLVLAQEAVEVSPTRQAEEALRQALLESHLERTFSEHDRATTGARFSTDGTRLLSAAHDGRTLIRDLRAGGGTVEVMGSRAILSPDGRLVATAAEDKIVRLWDAENGERLAELPGHGAHILNMAFSPDGTRLATGDRDGSTRVWSVPDARLAAGPFDHTGFVTDLAFGPHGELLAVAGFYNKTRVWELASGVLLLELDGYQVAFQPGGDWLVTGGVTGALNYWNIRTQASPTPVAAHAGPTNSVTFSPDGSRILSTGIDKTAKVWKLGEGTPETTLIGHTDWVEAGAFSPDAAYVLTGGKDRVARLWRLSTGLVVARLRPHGDQVTGVDFHPDGERMLTTANDGVVRIWKIAAGVPRLALGGHEYTVGALAVSPDGEQLATGSEDETARVWDVSSGAPAAPVLEHDSEVTGLAYTPDGRLLLSCDAGGHIVAWETATWRKVRAYELDVEFYDLAVSPGGEMLLASSNDGIHGLRLPALEPLRRIETEDLIVAVAFSRNGTNFATGSFDHTARVWDTRSFQPAGKPLEHEDYVTSVDFSSDGAQLLTASGDSATIWDLATGRVRERFSGHVDSLYTAVFSPAGDYILTASNDYTTRLWDVDSARTVLQLRGQTDAVYSAVFGPDGRWIATGSEDATTHIYDCDVCLTLEEMRALARKRSVRGLTPEERRKYLGFEAPE